MFKALDEFYLGVGVFALETTAAEKTLSTIYYTGERKPHMWWVEFERQITSAYATIDKIEGRQVYSNAQKLRTLVSKIKADFLGHQLAAINGELSRSDSTYTFENALSAIGNAVHLKHPPNMTDTPITRNPRHIRETSSRGRNQHGGRGRGGRGQVTNRARNQNEHTMRKDSFKQRHEVHKTRNDSEIVRLPNGRWIEYHPSFLFSQEMFHEFSAELKAKLKSQRDAHRASQRNTASIASVSYATYDTTRQIQALREQLDTLTRDTMHPPRAIAVDTQTQISQVCQVPAGLLMGGRNEQAQRHQPRTVSYTHLTLPTT
jgi:hypothetical protein